MVNYILLWVIKSINHFENQNTIIVWFNNNYIRTVYIRDFLFDVYSLDLVSIEEIYSKGI